VGEGRQLQHCGVNRMRVSEGRQLQHCGVNRMRVSEGRQLQRYGVTHPQAVMAARGACRQCSRGLQLHPCSGGRVGRRHGMTGTTCTVAVNCMLSPGSRTFTGTLYPVARLSAAQPLPPQRLCCSLLVRGSTVNTGCRAMSCHILGCARNSTRPPTHHIPPLPALTLPPTPTPLP
jgi:hypothetical protein